MVSSFFRHEMCLCKIQKYLKIYSGRRKSSSILCPFCYHFVSNNSTTTLDICSGKGSHWLICPVHNSLHTIITENSDKILFTTQVLWISLQTVSYFIFHLRELIVGAYAVHKIAYEWYATRDGTRLKVLCDSMRCAGRSSSHGVQLSYLILINLHFR